MRRHREQERVCNAPRPARSCEEGYDADLGFTLIPGLGLKRALQHITMNILRAIGHAISSAWNSISATSHNERYLADAVDIYDLERRMNERARVYLSIYPSGAGR
jgi:hypothetical protein